MLNKAGLGADDRCVGIMGWLGARGRGTACALGVVLLAALAAPPAAGSSLPGPVPPLSLPLSVDYAPDYQGQQTCNPVDSEGVQAIKGLILATYGSAVVGGSRSCGSSVSEHYDGRALDWMRSVREPVQAAQAEAFLAWLLAPAADGTPQEMARRLGVMYLIWNNQMIRTYDPGAGWTHYKGCMDPAKSAPSFDTGCHRDHVHISLTWDGAAKRTSWWTGVALTGTSPAAAEASSWPARAAAASGAVPAAAAPLTSTSTSVVPPRVAPSRPVVTDTKVGKGSVVVQWKAPRGSAASQVTRYLVTARAGSAGGPVAGTCKATSSARVCWISKLPRGMRYWVTVSAANLAGASKPAVKRVYVK